MCTASARLPAITRIAVLDDFQSRAAGYADWQSLGSDVEVEFFREPIAADDLPGAAAPRHQLPPAPRALRTAQCRAI